MESSNTPRRSKIRKHRKRIVTLLAVLAILSLVLGGMIATAALFHYEYEQDRFLRLGSYFIGAGLLFYLVYLLFFLLPDFIHDRRSAVASRRREVARNYKRPIQNPTVTNKNQGGSVLIIVLILLGLIAGTSYHAIVTARSSLARSANAMERGLLRLTAIDTVRAAMQELADDPSLNVDHLREAWAQKTERIDPSGTTRMVRVLDAQRAFDLNNMSITTISSSRRPADILADIMILGGEFRPGERIDQLRDWTDEDDAGNWESPYYLEKEPPSVVPNRMLYSWHELFQVEDWKADLFDEKPFRRQGALFENTMRDGLTLIPAPRTRPIPVNINTANAMTLQGILGIGREGVVERVLTQRADTPYQSTAFLLDLLGQTEYEAAAPYLDVRSEFFFIQATAYRDGISERINLLARRFDDGRVEALQAMF